MNRKLNFPQGLIYFGWTITTLSAICALFSVPLFFMELREPISSGNEGVTGMGIIAFWILNLLGVSLIISGKVFGKKPYSKFLKYGAIIFIGQFSIILLLSFFFPDSREWIWNF